MERRLSKEELSRPPDPDGEHPCVGLVASGIVVSPASAAECGARKRPASTTGGTAPPTTASRGAQQMDHQAIVPWVCVCLLLSEYV